MYDDRSGAFARLHPFTLAVYFTGVIVSTVISSNPVYACVGLIGAVLYKMMFGIKARSVFITAGFMTVLTIVNPLFSHYGNTPLLFINGKAYTLEALVYGAITAAVTVGVLLWCEALSLCMTSDKVIYLLGRTLPKTALLLSGTLRFIPMCRDKFENISRARKCIGRFSDDNIIDRTKSLLAVFSALSGSMIEGAGDTAASMKARGAALKGRTSFHLFIFTARDLVTLVLSSVSAGFIFYVTASGKAEFLCYPYLSGIPVNFAAAASYAVFFVMCLIPFFFEVREAIIWKLRLSKI